MCDSLNSSSKQEGSPSPPLPGSSPGRARSDLYDSVENFERSTESLLVSDSSEEDISLTACAGGTISPVEGVGGVDGKLVPGAGEDIPGNNEVELQQQAMAQKEETNSSDKKKKRKLSSRRGIKISIRNEFVGDKVSTRTTAQRPVYVYIICKISLLMNS